MPSGWLDGRTGRAPEVLRRRVQQHLADTGTGAMDDPTPEALAAAGRRALEQVLAHAGDRTVALDLLAADALVTLALLAQAERSPGELERFAAEVLRMSAADA
ncbi:MAG TPA: hypothetical protein VJQ44_13270 [Gemmatimonadales bacterium]|nr:hypothetical protein [Gemmatimonadales bacterium]